MTPSEKTVDTEALAVKGATPKLGEAPPIPALDAWILTAIEAAEAFCQKLPPRPADLKAVDAFFQTWAGLGGESS